MAKVEMPFIAWRDGRPRFVPGARERALGFVGQDLKHDDGRWFTLDEASGFATAKHQEIVAQRKTGKRLKSPPVPIGRAVSDLWNAYTHSDKFKSLAASSQVSYKKFIKPIEGEPLWHAPVAALDPVILKALHGKIQSDRGPSMANVSIDALAAALSWGRLQGWLPRINGQVVSSPALNLDLPTLPPRLRVGTDKELSALVTASDQIKIDGVALSAIGDAVLVGFFSGQRKKDVLEFIPGEQSNARIELLQSKTGSRVSIPMAPRLLERIAAGRVRRQRAGFRILAQNIVVDEREGRPYNGSTFRNHFSIVRAEAVKICPSLVDFTFPDLRDTAVTWYARAGSTIPEIASITGHAPGSIYSILKHYLALDGELADNAVAKLIAYMEREGLAV